MWVRVALGSGVAREAVSREVEERRRESGGGHEFGFAECVEVPDGCESVRGLWGVVQGELSDLMRADLRDTFVLSMDDGARLNPKSSLGILKDGCVIRVDAPFDFERTRAVVGDDNGVGASGRVLAIDRAPDSSVRISDDGPEATPGKSPSRSAKRKRANKEKKRRGEMGPPRQQPTTPATPAPPADEARERVRLPPSSAPPAVRPGVWDSNGASSPYLWQAVDYLKERRRQLKDRAQKGDAKRRRKSATDAGGSNANRRPPSTMSKKERHKSMQLSVGATLANAMLHE